MIKYFVLNKSDVEALYGDLTNLMETVLADNIPQNYPVGLAEEYVKRMANYIEDGSAFVVGAKDGEELTGFLWAYTLNIFDETRFHIDMICVNPEYRRMGIAGHLVELQVEEAKKRGIHAIEAMTTRSNENSYNWFHSLGFEDERVKVKLEI